MGPPSKTTVVYLDQMYLSGMIKQEPPQLAEVGAWLPGLVKQGSVACPKSMIHELETELDDRIAPRVRVLAAELSAGLRFLEDDQVVLGQVKRALMRYLGIGSEPEGGWAQAFNRSPQDGPTPSLVVNWTSVDSALPDRSRTMKQNVQSFRTAEDERWREARANAAKKPSFEDLVAAQFQGVVNQCFRPPADDPDSQPLAIQALEAAVELMGGAETFDPARYAAFLFSEEFRSVPYFDIFVQMYAGFLFHTQSRPPDSGDLYDFASIALALPYVDVLTTDSAMKNMVDRLGLDRKYGTEVYSPKVADVSRLHTRLSAPPM